MFAQKFSDPRPLWYSFIGRLFRSPAPAFQPVRMLVVGCLVLSTACLSHAQGTMSGGTVLVERPYNTGPGFYQSHSSTAAEGYFRGLASYVESVGVYKVYSAQANILNEEAYSMFLENAKQRVETFYARRRLRNDYLAEQRELSREQDRIGKELLAKRRATEYRNAYKLTYDEFDTTTGEIFWPEVLLTDIFNLHRDKLEELFIQRVKYNRENDETLIFNIEAFQKDMMAALVDYRKVMPYETYLEAKMFLLGLLYEAAYPIIDSNTQTATKQARPFDKIPLQTLQQRLLADS